MHVWGGHDGFCQVKGFLAVGREWGAGDVELADALGGIMEEGGGSGDRDGREVAVVGVKVGWELEAFLED